VSTVPAQDLSEVEIVADGSCLGNPGPGGWACILRCGERERVLQGSTPDTTNNRMELVAAIEGLRALKRACRVTVVTDSEYVRRGITEFLPRWKTNEWQLCRYRHRRHYDELWTMPNRSVSRRPSGLRVL
jgi:ribonuclease HI